MKLKTVAVTNTEPYNWTVLVELDRKTISELTRTFNGMSNPPKAGEEFDISSILARVSQLEVREDRLRKFGVILAEFLPQPEPEKAAQ